jgi:hypothetical protein
MNFQKIEHEQWMSWAQHVLKTENISEETRKTWETYFVPFDDLSPDVQAKDSYFAARALLCVKDIFNSL